MNDDSPDDPLAGFRSYLIGVCYRMLGSLADAEDMVQEAVLRWQRAGSPSLDAPRAWFTRVCVRLCLDELKSKRRALEEYPGEWLPEPLATASEHDRLDETVSLALLRALQRLSAKERASFILHDIFDYTFEETAEILELSPANCRQLASRARGHLQTAQPRFDVSPEEAERITTAFFSALETGDLTSLSHLLAEEVTLVADGGGKVSAVHYPLVGRERVQKFLERVSRLKPGAEAVARKLLWFNGAPGVVLIAAGRVVGAYQLQIAGGRVTNVWIQRNPDKLARLQVLLAAAGG